MAEYYLRRKLVVPCLLMMFCILCVMLTGGMAAASPVDVVKISGTAPAGQGQQALEHAKKRAVFKVFSHDTRAEKDSASIFAKMMDRYNDYVMDSQVLSENTSNAGLLVIAQVTVNHAKLLQDFQQYVEHKQLTNDAMTASILMRAVNTSDNLGYADSLHEAFNHRFSNSGFQTELEDNDIGIVRSLSAQGDYDGYMGTVKGMIDNNTIMANFAIVGEASIDSLEANTAGTGYVAKSSVRIQAYDCMKKTVLGSFSEDYEIVANTAQAAERLAIAKAGLDAAEAMANNTLDYWRKV